MPSLKRLFRRAPAAIVIATLLLGLCLAAAPAQAVTLHGTSLSTRVAPTGYYAAPVREANGHINVGATLRGIRGKGAKHYQYLVANRWGYNSVYDWGDLPTFLAAARRFSVTVDIVLVPPTEASASLPAISRTGNCRADLYPPYRGNYMGWAYGIGLLAKKYPALVGWGIDDYPYNSLARPTRDCNTFALTAPALLQARVNGTAGRVLTFKPTMYYVDLTTFNEVAKHKGAIKAVVYPIPEVGQEPSLLPTRYKAILKANPTLKVTIMCYASPVKGRPVPTASTVDRCVTAAKALRPAGGVVVYAQRLG